MPPKTPKKEEATQEVSIEPSTPAQPIATNEPITPANLKVTELRDALTARGLSPKGLKKELVERLEEAMKSEPSKHSQTTSSPQNKSQDNGVVMGNEEEQVDYTLEEKEVAPIKETKPFVSEAKPVVKEIKPVITPVIKQVDNEVKKDTTTKKDIDKKVEPKIVDAPTTNTTNTGSDCILHVTGFVRPFAVQSARDLFANHGPLKSFWMDSIKSFCFAEFEAASSASACYIAVNGLEFPSGFGKKLCAKFSDEATMKETQEKDATASAKRKASEAAPEGSDPKRPKGGKDLDELFKKTVSTPHLYYLPAKPYKP